MLESVAQGLIPATSVQTVWERQIGTLGATTIASPQPGVTYGEVFDRAVVTAVVALDTRDGTQARGARIVLSNPQFSKTVHLDSRDLEGLIAMRRSVGSTGPAVFSLLLEDPPSQDPKIERPRTFFFWGGGRQGLAVSNTTRVDGPFLLRDIEAERTFEVLGAALLALRQ